MPALKFDEPNVLVPHATVGPAPEIDSGPTAPETTAELPQPPPTEPPVEEETPPGAAPGVEIGSDPGGTSKKSSGCTGSGEPISSLFLVALGLIVARRLRAQAV